VGAYEKAQAEKGQIREISGQRKTVEIYEIPSRRGERFLNSYEARTIRGETL